MSAQSQAASTITATAADEPTSLSEADARAFLLAGVENPHCWLLKGSVARRTLRKLDRLFQRKRAELLPESPKCQFRLGNDRYCLPALQAMKRWLTMEKGHYGTKQDRRLDEEAAAKFAGCTRKTITKKLAGKGVADWSRNGIGEIVTYRVAHLGPIKEEREQAALGIIIKDGKKHYTLAAAANELGDGWAVGERNRAAKLSLLLDERRRSKAMAEKARARRKQSGKARRTSNLPYKPRGISLKATPELRPLWGHGRAETISEDELTELKAFIASHQRKPDWSTESELAREVGIAELTEKKEAAAHAHELHQCLKAWQRAGLLTPAPAIVERRLKYKLKRKDAERVNIHLLNTFDKKAFQKLWDSTTPKNGAALLKCLLKVGEKMPTEKLNEKMKAEGFVGGRLFEAKRLARVIDYVDGSFGDCHISERLPESEQAAEAIVERVIPKGPVASRTVKDATRMLREAGLLSKEKRDELRRQRITQRRAGAGEPRYYCRPGQKPPVNGASQPPANGAPVQPHERGHTVAAKSTSTTSKPRSEADPNSAPKSGRGRPKVEGLQEHHKQIAKAYRTRGKHTRKEIARQFNVSESTVAKAAAEFPDV